MKTYLCAVCGGRLYFENSVCLECGTWLGYSREDDKIVPVDDAGRHVDASGVAYWVCANLTISGCTWLTRFQGGSCSSCEFTRTRPGDDDATGLEQFASAERAKRQLLVELDRLHVPVVPRSVDSERGLCFDMLSSVQEDVVTGHADGVITIDLAEANASHREKVKDDLGEEYRTMLGHLRHESGHYFESVLLNSDDALSRCRELFGDDTASYQDALDRHYRDGAPEGWEASYISEYATMHPYEDFAETWAHVLHIFDTLDSAANTGLVATSPGAIAPFSRLVTEAWVPLSLSLNLVNRSMGLDDLYPFVIPQPVLAKLDFVADVIRGAA